MLKAVDVYVARARRFVLLLLGLAFLSFGYADRAHAAQANDGSNHFAVITTSGTHLQFNDQNDTTCSTVSPACYVHGWVINDGTQYLASYIGGTCNSSSTTCHVKDSQNYCWTATKPANGLWNSISNITDASVASANSCRNPPAPPPTVTNLSPASGLAAGGTTVVITGTNFTGVSAVRFGATNAASFTVNSATQITATSPAGSAGTINVTVTAAGGTSGTGAANQFTYVTDTTAPTVTITAPATATGAFTATFTFNEDVTGFTLGDITVGNGAASNFAGGPQVYTATVTPTSHGTVTLDVAAGVAQDAANNQNTAAAQVRVNYTDNSYVQARTKAVTSNFISNRGSQIVNGAPDLSDRLTGGPLGGTPFGFNGMNSFSVGGFNMTGGPGSMSFSGSLNRTLSAIEQLKQGDGALGARPADAIAYSKYDFWIEGKLSRIKNGASNSSLAILYFGADYRVTPTTLIGVAAQIDNSEQVDRSQNFSIDGVGWMIGPYVATRLTQNLIFDSRAAWGQSNNKVSPFNTYVDKFDSTRWLLSGKFTGDFKYGPWAFQPHIGVTYFNETQHGYTDSLGNAIASQSVALGRLSFGPRIIYRVPDTVGYSLALHAGIRGLWDFKAAQTTDMTTGIAVTGNDDIRARVELGLIYALPESWTFGVQGFYDGIGASGYSAYGGLIRLSLPSAGLSGRAAMSMFDQFSNCRSARDRYCSPFENNTDPGVPLN